MMSHRPFGLSYADIAACPSKKLSVRRSTTCLAVCSLPMAKLARWVDGVRVEVIEWWQSLRGRERAIIRDYPVIGSRNNPAFPMGARHATRNSALESVIWGYSR